MAMLAAIDPGRDKCGFALLNSDGSVVRKSIVPTENLLDALAEATTEYEVTHIVLGNGTTSKKMRGLIGERLPHIPVNVVDEYKTTELARRDYFAENPPKGWRRLLPLSMQTPPVPVDDFAAVRLGRKFLYEKE